jgi:hypothetical protein
LLVKTHNGIFGFQTKNMRKLYLLVVTGIISSSVQAQITKGSVMLGGSLRFENMNEEQQTGINETRYFSIAPQAGVAVKDNLVAGVSFGYGGFRNIVGNTRQTLDAVDAGVFLRRYLGLGKSFYLFGEAALEYTGSRQNSDEHSANNAVIKTRGGQLSLTPGVAYAINRKLHLEGAINSVAAVGFNRQTRTTNTGTSTLYNQKDLFTVQTNLSAYTPLSLGMRLFFARGAN